MDNVNNIPTGLLVPAQIPLDAKRVVLNNTILQNLGIDDNLAFTYEDGLIVFSVATRQRWEWRQVKVIEEDTALLPTPFVYPSNHIIAGIDYSDKEYNFFLKREVLPMINLGLPGGKKVYKGINVVNEKHEFYTLETDGKITLSYPTALGEETGVLLFTFPGFENLGTGVPVFKGYNSDDNKFEFYTLDSSDIKIELNTTTGVITLSLPQSSSVPSIYINQDYVPTYDDWFKANRTAPGNGGTAQPGFEYKGEGTLARPFTNTVTYTLGTETPLPVTTLPDTAIKNGMAYYVGDGDRLAPERQGQKIQILASPVKGVYNYPNPENFSYTGLNLEIYGYVSSLTTGRLVDMDDPSYFDTATTYFNNIKIYIDDEATLVVNGSGFWNSGHNISGQVFTFGKVLYLLGKGTILSVQDNISNYIINAGISQPSYNNAGFLTFEITCQISCLGNGTLGGGQGVIQNGGLSKVEFRDGAIINSGRITAKTSIDLETIKITGGFVRVFDSIISLQGTNTGVVDGADRTRGIVLQKSGDLDTTGGPQLYLVNTSLRGHAETWFDRKGDAGNLFIINCSSIYFEGGDLIKSTGTPLTVWGLNRNTRGQVSLKNNTFDNININTEKIDLTVEGSQAVSNTVGANLIQSLRTFYSRADAITAGIPKGGLYIRRYVIKDFTADQLVSYKRGDIFKIGVQSSPVLEDFTALQISGSTSAPSGLPSNVLNTYFEYNGTGTISFVSPVAELWHDVICVMT